MRFIFGISLVNDYSINQFGLLISGIENNNLILYVENKQDQVLLR